MSRKGLYAVLILILYLLLLGLTLYVIDYYPKDAIANHLIDWMPWTLRLNFALLLAGLVYWSLAQRNSVAQGFSPAHDSVAQDFSPAQTNAALKGCATDSAINSVAQGFSPANDSVAQDFSPARTNAALKGCATDRTINSVARGFSPANDSVAQDFSPAQTNAALKGCATDSAINSVAQSFSPANTKQAALTRIMHTVARTEFWLPALLVVFAFILVSFVPPRIHRLFYDEDIYANIGQTIAYLGRAAMCSFGSFEYGDYACSMAVYNKEPNGWPFLISLAFQIFGLDEGYAFKLNNLLFAGSTLIVYLIGRMLTKRFFPAMIGALAYALIPHNLIWSNTVAAEPAASFFSGLAALFLIAWIQSPKKSLLFLFVVTLPLACQMRAESGLIAIWAVAAIAFISPRALFQRQTWALGLLALVFLIPHFLHLYAMSGQSWGAEGPKFSTAFFLQNIAVNGPYYISNHQFPLGITFLALLGCLRVGRSHRWPLLLLLWFVLFWGIFLFFYAGSYRYGTDVRFALVTFMPLAILAGMGGGVLKDWIGRMMSHVNRMPVAQDFSPAGQGPIAQGFSPANAEQAALKGCATDNNENSVAQGFSPESTEQAVLKGCATNRSESSVAQRFSAESAEQAALKGCATDRSESSVAQRFSAESAEQAALKGCATDRSENSVAQGFSPANAKQAALKGCATDRSENSVAQRFSAESTEQAALKGCASNTEGNVPVACAPHAGGLPTRFAAAVIVLVLLFSWLPFLPLVRTVGQEAWGARFDHRYALEFLQKIPDRSIILTHNPNIFLLHEQNAVQAHIALTDRPLVRQLMERYPGQVYFHFNFWCNTVNDPNKKLCGDIMGAYRMEEVAAEKEQDYRYGLYRMHMK